MPQFTHSVDMKGQTRGGVAAEVSAPGRRNHCVARARGSDAVFAPFGLARFAARWRRSNLKSLGGTIAHSRESVHAHIRGDPSFHYSPSGIRPIGLTRRQSQRRDLSRAVQIVFPKECPKERHSSRQAPPWLIFDVGHYSEAVVVRTSKCTRIRGQQVVSWPTGIRGVPWVESLAEALRVPGPFSFQEACILSWFNA